MKKVVFTDNCGRTRRIGIFKKGRGRRSEYDVDRQSYNEHSFDHIVSLGYNCEVSFRIKDYIRKDIDSYPLSWSYMLDQTKISSIIGNLEDMFTGESTVNIESGMIKCEKLNVSWHTKIDHTNLSEENRERYKDSALLEMKERYSYLRKKFNNLFNSSDSTLFIIKCQEWNEYSEIVRYLGELEQKLNEKYISGKYFLLAVTDDKELYDILVPESNAVRGCTLIAQFAEDSNTQQGGDIDGWMEAIHYYNHLKDINRNNMNYIVSTVEHRHKL